MSAVLFLDLDNTVIYSHRRPVEEPKRWVEELRGAPQSFMTEYTWSYLRRQRWLKVIPVTTRTAAQYARLGQLARDLGWDTALICNGAVLLRDGKEDLRWREESLRRSRRDRQALQAACRFIRGRTSPESVAAGEPFLFYVKTEEGERVCECLRENTDPSRLSVCRDDRKVYCVPNSLGKGEAVSRYLKRYGGALSISAGDGALDISMLNRTDVCLCPEDTGAFAGAVRKIVCTGPVFSNEICDRLEQLRNEAGL